MQHFVKEQFRSSRKASNLYSGKVQLELRLGHLLNWLQYLVTFLCPSN